MRFTNSQSGMALALVLWMLTALTVLVAGLVAISREGAGSIDAKVISAKAFYIGKGAARLAMRDRAHDRSGEGASGSGDDGFQSVETLLVHDGVDAYITVYGSICSNNSADLITISSNINGVSGNVAVYAVSDSASCVVNLVSSYIKT